MNDGSVQAASHQSDVTYTSSPTAKGQKKRILKLILITWIAAIGFDFLWHGGILAEIYTHPNPALLDPLQAFTRIPFGYGALLLVLLIAWS